MPQLLTREAFEAALKANQRPSLSEFPLRGNYIEWINEVGKTLWNDIAEFQTLINPILKLKTDRLICSPPKGLGWHKRTTDDWAPVTVDDLPACMVVDVDPDEEPGIYQCVGLAVEGWYVWRGRTGTLIPSVPGTLFIAHNGCEHDSQYCESEYLPPNAGKTAWIDTRSLSEALRGVHPDNRAQYIKFKAQLESGKGGVPEWVAKTCDSNLADAVRSFCGIQINKSVGGDLFSGEVAPQTVFEYCCQDVWATLKLFQVVYPMARGAIQSDAWWWGRLAVTGLRVNADHYQECIASITALYDEAKDIKPADRLPWQTNIVKWGAHHLTNFSSGVVHNGMLNLRVNPCDVLGRVKSDWIAWTTVDGINAWDFDPEKESAYPVIGLAGQDGKDGYWDVSFILPSVKKLSPSRAKILAGQALIESRYLKFRCPQSITGEKLKADWLKTCDQPDVLMMFVTVMDAFILEYDLDAWLSVPGLYHAMYSCKDGQELKLQECGFEAIRIIEEIVKNG